LNDPSIDCVEDLFDRLSDILDYFFLPEAIIFWLGDTIFNVASLTS